MSKNNLSYENNDSLFFEDYEIGQKFVCPPIEFTQDNIKEFASKHDPREFHLSEEAGEKTMFKGLISSGFHTLTDTWRSWVDMGLENEATICGVGLDKVLWSEPVRPGDRTVTSLEVIDKQKREKKNDGVITFAVKANNQDGKEVISYEAKVLTSLRKEEK